MGENQFLSSKAKIMWIEKVSVSNLKLCKAQPILSGSRASWLAVAWAKHFLMAFFMLGSI